MKKRIISMLILCAMLLAGCSSAEVETTQDTDVISETPAAESSEIVEETAPAEE